mmetsp:Transcript_2877/g.3932  ORF Transcript_2877/g.3932 Transcript_2877/m.3932 type:complete len:232 (+) Transcript_2877:54-749(+)|eukprot:CAMPEP_0185579524 /NCGR_PEP_ID=MMETSP0434-20130131/15074_1 /TAXON_ID=626734 ORGANISM="Favella taraikaensis, Strain Fe Narragansett Bay" /NCGR_SAMPLE_ID=MMETSP0434 /ASSEMBLY_ACC=CAM_ASM_000379 /LENGTH=231 /DNA_ID=CAMNT_0028197561 /DNA_START=51 /DNA_END=746 /DNA_ORIENTATION=-
MVKQKIHTARNQTYKAHRNGIKKPKKYRYRPTKGMDPKFLRNARYALHGTKKALRSQKATGDGIQMLMATPAPDATITLRSGRKIPLALCGGEMISVTNKSVMRLLLGNQATLSALFEEYAKDGEMSMSEGLRFAGDFDIVPDICNKAQFKELWELVNASEAADDDAEQCDSEEFVELMVRIAAFYSPGDRDLFSEPSLADAFRVMLTFMNNSSGGKARKVNFKVDKVKGK